MRKVRLEALVTIYFHCKEDCSKAMKQKGCYFQLQPDILSLHDHRAPFGGCYRPAIAFDGCYKFAIANATQLMRGSPARVDDREFDNRGALICPTPPPSVSIRICSARISSCIYSSAQVAFDT